VHRVAVERAQRSDVVADRLGPQPVGCHRAHHVFDVLGPHALQSATPEMRLDPHPQHHLDRREGAALAAKGLQVLAVAPANLCHVQPVALCRVRGDLARESPQLRLCLRGRQPLSAAACALHPQPAIHPPAIRPPRAIEGLSVRAVCTDIHAPTAIRATRRRAGRRHRGLPRRRPAVLLVQAPTMFCAIQRSIIFTI
jgi:hypothetical protein